MRRWATVAWCSLAALYMAHGRGAPALREQRCLHCLRGGDLQKQLAPRTPLGAAMGKPVRKATGHQKPHVAAKGNTRDAGLERRLFACLAGMLFSGLFSYQLLQSTKDTILVDACGAEAITFVKVYGVLPASMIFLSFQSRMQRTGHDGWPRSSAYLGTALPFLLFFLLFGTVMYPLRHWLHPTHLPQLPPCLGALGRAKGLRSVELLARHWTFALYYIFSELYGNVGVSILFWQFSNNVVSVQQAAQFYPVFARFTWVAPLLAGQALVLADKVFAGSFVSSLRAVTALVMLSGCAMIALHRVALTTARQLGRHRHLADEALGGVPGSRRRKKSKPGLFQSLLLVSSSRYLACVAVLVLSYGFCMNFTEVTWKTMVRRCYTDLASYQRFLGWFSMGLGMSIFLSSLLAPWILSTFGWRVSALLVPTVMATLAVPLYRTATITSGDACAMVGVLAGCAHNLASKSLKFTVFDPTKNMAYLPLPADVRARGQAAIDVLGGRLGKSGAALLQQLVIVSCDGDITKGVGVIAVMYALVTCAWVTAANGVARQLPADLSRPGARKTRPKSESAALGQTEVA